MNELPPVDTTPGLVEIKKDDQTDSAAPVAAKKTRHKKARACPSSESSRGARVSSRKTPSRNASASTPVQAALKKPRSASATRVKDAVGLDGRFAWASLVDSPRANSLMNACVQVPIRSLAADWPLLKQAHWVSIAPAIDPKYQFKLCIRSDAGPYGGNHDVDVRVTQREIWVKKRLTLQYAETLDASRRAKFEAKLKAALADYLDDVVVIYDQKTGEHYRLRFELELRPYSGPSDPDCVQVDWTLPRMGVDHFDVLESIVRYAHELAHHALGALDEYDDPLHPERMRRPEPPPGFPASLMNDCYRPDSSLYAYHAKVIAQVMGLLSGHSWAAKLDVGKAARAKRSENSL